jgi:undecaprenyl pyrophosphate synthase
MITQKEAERKKWDELKEAHDDCINALAKCPNTCGICFNQGKAQALADVMKIIDEKGITMIDYQNNWGSRTDEEVREIIKLFKEELKAKLQSPNKSEARNVKSSSVVEESSLHKQVQTGSDTIQKAISEFKEKLKDKTALMKDQNDGRKEAIIIQEIIMEFEKEIDKTAQEITGK